MTEGWQLDDRTVQALRAALDRGDADVTNLVRQASERALAAVSESVSGAGTAESQGAERRLGDRILGALDLALDQDDLEVSEHLELAFEAAMTRFGGPDAVEMRDCPEGMQRVYERLDELRRRRYRA